MNYIANQNMTLNSVEVDANGHATINFDGEFLLIGTCGDPHIEAQLLLSIFADPQVTSARININGENIKPVFDMSGQTEPDEIYTPDDIPLRPTN